MTKAKDDIRGYVNPYVPGGRVADAQRAAMAPSAEVYVEDRRGEVWETFVRHLRSGSVVEVEELHYLAPGRGRADKRRRILSERIDAIQEHGATIRETYNGSNAKMASMLLRAYEQIATSGRARKRPGEGRPPEWPKPPATIEAYEAIWFRRGLDNDVARREAIVAKFGTAPSVSWLRNILGSPTGQKKA